MIDEIPGFSLKENNETGIAKKTGKNKKGGGFQTMGLSFPVLKGITRRGYSVPTPIQRKTIPIILEGRDVVAMAKTGSGKTACFLIPLFERLKQRQAKSGARALILSPTRELAIQTFKFIKDLGKFVDLKAILILGGDSMDSQFSAMHTNPDIIVATPGRLLHLCVEMDMKLNAIDYCVFDEADRLFEMGFGEQLTELLNRLPQSKQMVMFSATLPKLMVDFAKAGLSDPVLIRLDVETKIPETLTLKFLFCRPQERYATLLVLLKYIIPSDKQTVVFAGTQHHVELISMLLNKANISNSYVYSTLDPSARKINTAKFTQNKVSVLIVTDVAARGIDIPNLDYVINFHFPGKPKLFVHRVGRCARAGREGTAFSIFSTDDQAHLLDLHLFLSRPFSIMDSSSIGVAPIDYVEDEHNSVLEWLTDSNLEKIHRTSNNAYKNYLQTRPIASVDSNKRVKSIDFFKLRTLDIFNSTNQPEVKSKKSKKKNNSGNEEKKNIFDNLIKDDILNRMKNYRPSNTIFELNSDKLSVPSEVMKRKRETHQDVIEKFKKQIIDREANELLTVKEEKEDMESSTLATSTEDDIKSTFSKVLENKKPNLEHIYKDVKKKKRKMPVRDVENYIPYNSSDKHTEEGLAINSFQLEAQNAELNVIADNREGVQISKKLKKWDRVRKKMVSVQDPKQGKIRTESGLWIPATYKTGRYNDWKNKTKIDERETHNDEEDVVPIKKRTLNTHWAKHNAKVELKKRQGMDKEIKRPEQIAKERLRKEKIKRQMAENRKRRDANRKRSQKQRRQSAKRKSNN